MRYLFISRFFCIFAQNNIRLLLIKIKIILYLMNGIALNKVEILSRSKMKWDSKNKEDRIRVGSKYQHFLSKYKFKVNDWHNDFDCLTRRQQNVIVKGELIRTYDSLPNLEKTAIMRELGLTNFSSKWYKLSSEDKKILLNYVLK